MLRKILFCLLPITIILFFMSFNNCYAQEAKKVIDILPLDDAYVATDRYDPQDSYGYQKINTGNHSFLKVWYAWNATTTGKQFIVTVAYLKFDLTNVTSDRIESASLNLYPFSINLTNESRHVDVFTALNSDWNETKIVYLNAPHFYANGSSALIVNTSDLNKYVTSDITPQVKSHAGSYLTLALLFHINHLHNEELIDFYSKDYADPLKRPKLELITTPETSISGQALSNFGNNTTIDNSGYGYVISGIIGAALGIGGFAAIKRRKKIKSTESKPNVISDANTKKESQTGPTSSKEVELGQANKQKDSVSDSIQCQRCGKTILKGFKLCPYCGNIRSTNFPL